LHPTVDEMRYPCLDQTLTEFLTSIPTDQLLRVGERRSLMRRALVNIVPSNVLSRRTKQREGRCYIATLAKHWQDLSGILISPIVSRLEYVNESEFRAALRNLKNTGRLSIESMMLLRGLFLELWLRTAIGHKAISIPGNSTVTAGLESTEPGLDRPVPAHLMAFKTERR
jgi:asparagine synthase (glutamine-hydrolysing)